jgi:diphthamide biosynthesis protein 2
MKTVCLQMPDHLLGGAMQVMQELKENILKENIQGENVLNENNTILLLPNNDCCIEPFNSDLIVHYGHSCLSKPNSNYKLVFEQWPITDRIISILLEFEMVLVYYHTSYHHKMSTIDLPNVIMTQMDLVPCVRSHEYLELHGRFVKIPPTVNLQTVPVLYVGPQSITLTRILMSHQNNPFTSYDPASDTIATETTSNRLLMKRYALIQKAKDAAAVGIVVATSTVGKSSWHMTNVYQLEEPS